MVTRKYGDSGLEVSALAFGGWPIAGMGWSGVNERDSIATIHKAMDTGINFIDTAYMYGENGESEILVGKAVADRRDEVVVATKCGVHWENGKAVSDSSPPTIRRQVEESLRRLSTNVIDLYQVHSPDNNTPFEETAAVMASLLEEGKIRAIGVSNYNVKQMQVFSQVAPIHSLQPRYSMIDRRIEEELVPYCVRNKIGICVYCPLERGLLTNRIKCGNEYPEDDDRHENPSFMGEEFSRTKAMNDALTAVARERGVTLAQLVLNWTVHQPGITVAIVGATRPNQVAENAESLNFELSDVDMSRIDEIIASR
jgi:aryl-alcohol dehydrogenase-like predicted oxidoreductase